MGTAAARAALAQCRRRTGRGRCDHPGHQHAGPGVSGHRAARAGGARRAGGFGFDLSAACAGFIYALSVADGMIRAGQVARRAGDRQRGLFAHPELAGPRHLRAVRRRRRCGVPACRQGRLAAIDRGILSTHLHAQGTLGDILYVDGAVGRPDQPGHLVMNGREVFRHAVTAPGRGGR